jgi:uncharacterized protein (TIGR01244 family)
MFRAARSLRFVLAGSALCLLFGQPANASGPASPVAEVDLAGVPEAVEDPSGVHRRLFLDGRVYIAGQPSEESLARFKELGVTAVVNFRTQREMDNREYVPFDEAAALSGLEIEYHHLPIGGDDHPWRTEVVDELARVLEEHRGPVLIHCTVAWRASYVWTAYLVRHGGLSLDQALERGKAIALDENPLGQLIGRPIELVFAAEAAEAPGEEP